MAVTINASTSSGLVQTADTSGEIQLQSNGSAIGTFSSTGLAMASGKKVSYTGAVLQVVSQTFQGTQFSTTSNSMVATGFGVSITPTSASSKIFVSISTSLSYGGSGQGIAIYRGTTLAWNPSITDGSGITGNYPMSLSGVYQLIEVGDLARIDQTNPVTPIS